MIGLLGNTVQSIGQHRGLVGAVYPAGRAGSALRRGLVLAFCLGLYPSVAFALDPSRTLTQYALDNWSSEDGLPQNTVNVILQTRDGYLWLGTQGGLARFDGVRFKVFRAH